MPRIRYFIFISLILFMGCATVYNPATERKEFILINTATEISLGKAMANQVALEYKISKDTVLNNRLNTIGQKVALQSDRQDLHYSFSIIEDKELNAFAIPGGFIFVNSGLMEKATDIELACVLAHEIGHIAAKHPVKRLQTIMGYQILMSIAFNKASSATIAQATDIVFNLVALGYSREDERLADKLAVKYAYKAGFDPEGMVSFFKKLKAEKDKGGPSLNLVFLSSHPPIEERIKNVQSEIDIIEGKKPPPVTKNIQSSDRKAKTVSNNLTYSQSKEINPQPNITRKICPKCKKIYSSQYNFCSQDGSRLIIP